MKPRRYLQSLFRLSAPCRAGIVLPCVTYESYTRATGSPAYTVMIRRTSMRCLPAIGLLLHAALLAADGRVAGKVTDPQGEPLAGAALRLSCGAGAAQLTAASGPDGRFVFRELAPGRYTLVASAAGFQAVTRNFPLAEGESLAVDTKLALLSSRHETVTVTADASDTDLDHPDPAQHVDVHDDILDANPGRPGAPVSIPGLPVESASGGIKAPQYFAPGVAGDHGEPIAQYLAVGSFLVANNLSANAHGNGYADPNIMIPEVIEAVETDGGAFNVREGNHSVDMAAIYVFHPRLEPFATVTGDYRDIDLAAGWSPADPATKAWLAIQASYGNGFLDRLEHRRQYKFNGQRVFDIGHHRLSLFGIGYYGFSMVPGLVPIDVPNLHDTIDPRQKDQTHTAEVALDDVWHVTESSEVHLSGLFRTYNLALDSNFGEGLIRQSEFRTVTGGSANYIHPVNRYLRFLVGVDDQRDAPRRLDLDHYESSNPAVYGPFEKVTANNVTLDDLAPYVALDGKIAAWLHFNLGWRRDEVGVANSDLLNPANSYRKWIGVDSPKATLSLIAPERLPFPSLSISFGQTFFTNDPRVGTGTVQGTPVSRAHAYQVVAHKTMGATDLRVTLGRPGVPIDRHAITTAKPHIECVLSEQRTGAAELIQCGVLIVPFGNPNVAGRVHRRIGRIAKHTVARVRRPRIIAADQLFDYRTAAVQLCDAAVTSGNDTGGPDVPCCVGVQTIAVRQREARKPVSAAVELHEVVMIHVGRPDVARRIDRHALGVVEGGRAAGTVSADGSGPPSYCPCRRRNAG